MDTGDTILASWLLTDATAQTSLFSMVAEIQSKRSPFL